MKKNILGIDANLKSMAWAILEQENGNIKLKKAGYVKQESSMQNNQDRRAHRSIRTQIKRKVSRKKQVLRFCIAKKLISFPYEKLHQNFQLASQLSTKELEAMNNPLLLQIKDFINLDTWQLRIAAVEGKKLTPQELSRVFYQLAMRRGFPEQSFRFQDSVTKVRSGAEETLAYLKKYAKKNQQDIYYAYLGNLLPDPKSPYKDLEKQELKRIRERFTYREVYQKEFNHIWKQQARYHASLTQQDKKNLYHYLFYQLPLKPPQKGACSLEPKRQRALKSSLLFETFRAYLFANNFISSLKERREIGIGEEFIKLRNKVVEIMHTSQKKNFTIKDLMKKLNTHYKTTYKDDKKLPVQMPITTQLITIFGKKRWQNFSDKERYDIWHLVCQEHNNLKALKKLAKKYELDDKASNKLQKDFNIPLSSQGVAKYSAKAINKLLLYLKEGYTEDKAILLAGIPSTFVTRDEEGKTSYHWNNLSAEEQKEIIQELKHGIFEKRSKLREDFQKFLQKNYSQQVSFETPYMCRKSKKDTVIKTNNPTVDSSLNLTRKVVRSLQQRYHTLDQINVEMARELRQSEKVRTEESIRNSKAQQYHDMTIWDLQNQGIPITKRNLLKYKLWKECKHMCVYSGRTMPIEKVFSTQPNDTDSIEIEHIIPRPVDDSRFINLTLSYRRENAYKGNRTPYEAFKEDPTKWEHIQKNAKKCFSITKRDRFLAKERPDETFIQGTLDLTGYISKKTASMVEHYTDKVAFTKGGVVSKLRQNWGLDELLNPMLVMDPATPVGAFTLVYTEKPWQPDRVLPEREVLFFEQYKPDFLPLLEKDSQEALHDESEKKSMHEKVKELQRAIYQKKQEKKQNPKDEEIKNKLKQLTSELKEIRKKLTDLRKAFTHTVSDKAQELQEEKGIKNKANILYEEGYVGYCDRKDVHDHYINEQYVPCQKDQKYFSPDNKKNRHDQRHHIIDACVIATVNHQQNLYYNKANKKKVPLAKQTNLKTYPLPYPTFREDLVDILKNTLLASRTKQRGLEKRKQNRVMVAHYPQPGGQQEKIYRWEKIKNSLIPRGELHEATFYAKNNYTNKFVVRKEVKKSDDFKKAVYNTLKDGTSYPLIIEKENKPSKFYLPNKRPGGHPVPIKKLRICTREETPIMLRNKLYVKPANNYLMAIYKVKNTYQQAIISFFDFCKLKKENKSVQDHFASQGINPILIIRKGDHFLFNFPKGASLDNLSLVSSCLYRTVSICSTKTRNHYGFVRHLRASRNQLCSTPPECIIQSAKTLMAMKPQKVLIDVLGNLLKVK